MQKSDFLGAANGSIKKAKLYRQRVPHNEFVEGQMNNTIFDSQHLVNGRPEIWHTEALNFYRDILNVFAGSDHGVKVGVSGVHTTDQRVEFLGDGSLPSHLRVNLLPVRAYWERPSKRSINWDDVMIVWHEARDGRGPRFAITGLGALVDLLVEQRHLRISARAARQPRMAEGST